MAAKAARGLEYGVNRRAAKEWAGMLAERIGKAAWDFTGDARVGPGSNGCVGVEER
jgi:hypothetical protein